MALSYVTLTVTSQDAGQDAETGAVTVIPTSVVTASGVMVVSQDPVVRQLSGGTASVLLVASDNVGTLPASGFWAYSIAVGSAAPQLYLVNFANGATQRLDSLTPVVAKTTYGPAAAGALAAKPGSTSVPAAEISPQVVALTDAATIAVNAALGNEMRVTLGGNRTIGAPSNPADGQQLTFELVQDATGSRTVTWTGGTGGYSFGSGAAPVLSTAAHAVDLLAFRYSAAAANGAGAWCFLGSLTGY